MEGDVDSVADCEGGDVVEVQVVVEAKLPFKADSCVEPDFVLVGDGDMACPDEGEVCISYNFCYIRGQNHQRQRQDGRGYWWSCKGGCCTG